MTKHIPLRMCVSCRERKEKFLLIKVVRTAEGFFVDKECSIEGRGAYVCKNPDCINKAVKKRGFDRSFKQKLPDEIYQKIADFTEE